MPRRILFVQGAGKDVYDTWDNKLVASLQRCLGSNYTIRYPQLPREDDPSYARWSVALRHEFHMLADGDFIVAHSTGGAILLHTLAEQPPPFVPRAAFLIATPYIGQGGWPSDEIDTPGATLAALAERLRIIFYQGTDDEVVPPHHRQLYAQAMPGTEMKLIEGADHQLGNDLTQVARDIEKLDSGE